MREMVSYKAEFNMLVGRGSISTRFWFTSITFFCFFMINITERAILHY